MTVYRIGRDKIKISLSDGEVLSYFGTYENVAAMSGSAKLIVGMLLQETLAGCGLANDEKLLVEISARENSGCTILISPAKKALTPGRKRTSCFMLEFADCGNMTDGIVRLYRKGVPYRRVHSSLYKMPDTYRLLISAVTDLFFMNEYCIRISESPLDAAYTEEYGRLISDGNAVERLGSAFLKTFD